MYGRFYLPKALSVGTWYTIGQLPEGFYPKNTHANFSLVSFRGMYADANVATDGSIQIRPEGTAYAGWVPVIPTSWFIN